MIILLFVLHVYGQPTAFDWVNDGLSLVSQNKINEAIKFYDVAIELDPNCTVAWANKADALDKLGKYDEAIKCYGRVIKLDPTIPGMWNNLGLNLQKQGYFTAAIKCYDEALRLNLGRDYILKNKYNALIMRNDLYDAEEASKINMTLTE